MISRLGSVISLLLIFVFNICLPEIKFTVINTTNSPCRISFLKKNKNNKDYEISRCLQHHGKIEANRQFTWTSLPYDSELFLVYSDRGYVKVCPIVDNGTCSY